MGTPLEKVLAIGAEHNDLSRFAVAGYSTAVRSAHVEVRMAAEYIISANTAQGVAFFLRDLLS